LKEAIEMATWHVQAPLDEDLIRNMTIGDIVYISGTAFTCRSRLQRWIFDEHHDMPDRTAKIDVLIHSGPIVLEEQDGYRLVSFMPTSSLRFEKWGASSIEAWNLRMIVGKTTMGSETSNMMVKRGCVHVSPQSVSPNLWIDSIKIVDVALRQELGSIEAPWIVTCTNLGPFVVDMDTHGNNLFEYIDLQVEQNKEKAFSILGIEKDFKPTKLYGLN